MTKQNKKKQTAIKIAVNKGNENSLSLSVKKISKIYSPLYVGIPAKPEGLG